MKVRTLDYHTAGEPLRIVTSGLPDIPGRTMLERRRNMQAELDHYRRFLMLEPRGHADMYGAVLTMPEKTDGDVGVLFLHNAGYSTMCGHGIIGLVTAGLEYDLFPVRDRSAIRIDTPAGRVTASATVDSRGQVESVSFLNVPSFVWRTRVPVEAGGRKLNCTVAFGGAFYAYVRAEPLGLELVPQEASRLIELGREIKERLSTSLEIRHPEGEDDLNFLYGTIFVRSGHRPGFSRNVCIFADGELDRSPTGTGVSGRAAIHYSQGDVALGQELEIESIIGSTFQVSCVEETRVGELPAVIPEVTGSAYLTGRHEFVLDQGDPLREGFLVR
jgi:trans-L-3-hydroxyproline dehydratase